MIVENNGNVNVNISIYSQDNLWNRAELNTTFIQFMVGIYSDYTTAFDTTNSLMSWNYMQNETYKKMAFADLNYTTGKDKAELEIYVKVPADEPPGTKSTTIVFEAVSNG